MALPRPCPEHRQVLAHLSVQIAAKFGSSVVLVLSIELAPTSVPSMVEGSPVRTSTERVAMATTSTTTRTPAAVAAFLQATDLADLDRDEHIAMIAYRGGVSLDLAASLFDTAMASEPADGTDRDAHAAAIALAGGISDAFAGELFDRLTA